MKKIILSALVAVSALSANAQVWMGGALGFGVKDFEGSDDSQLTLTVKPEVGYTINENWDVAVGLGFNILNNELGRKDHNTTTFSVNPYARYTFAKTGIASFFVDGGVSFESVKLKGSDATTAFWVGVRPGFKVTLSDKVSLVSHVGNLGYKTVKDTYNEFGFGVDNNAIDFGLYWAF